MGHEASKSGAKWAGILMAAILVTLLGGCRGMHHRHHCHPVVVARGSIDFPLPAPRVQEAPQVVRPEPLPVAEAQVVEQPIAESTVAAVEPLPEPPAPATYAVVIVGTPEGADQLQAWIQEEMLVQGLLLAGPHEATHSVRVEVGVWKVLDLGGSRALVSGRAVVSLQAADGRLLDRATLDRRSNANGTEAMARDQVRARLAAAVASRIDASLGRISEQETKMAPSGTEDAYSLLNSSGDPVKKDA